MKSFENSPEYEEQRLMSALDALDPSTLDYADWFKVIAALKHSGYDYSVADEWSRRDTQCDTHGKSRYTPNANIKTWESIDESSNPVTLGTIFKMAQEHGWTWDKSVNNSSDNSISLSKRVSQSPSKSKLFQSKDKKLAPITRKVILLNNAHASLECTLDKAKTLYENGRDMAIQYLKAVFRDDETTEIVGDMIHTKDKDGNEKLRPKRMRNFVVVKDLIDSIEQCNGNAAQIFDGKYEQMAGAWILDNPFSPEKLEAKNYGATNESVIAFRHVLVESDRMDIHDQERLLRASWIPIAALTYSGGKSIHALVKIDARNRSEYDERVKFLFDYLESSLGFDIDDANKNPARLTRFAGFKRAGKMQYLLGTNIGAKSWDEWSTKYNAALKDDDAQEKEEEAQSRIEESFLENYVSGFLEKIATSFNTPRISTGFGKLDELLGGGLFEGLYVLGAIPSLGKTTLVMQMADNIAKQGRRVLIFSLEMARYELIAKSISRLTYMYALECDKKSGNIGEHEYLAKTVREITDAEKWVDYSDAELNAIYSAIASYESIVSDKRIAIEEGIGDISAETIRDEVKAYTDLCGVSPVVVVDYLQILAPINERGTDKQNNDRAIMELKRISRDFKIPVIVVSSFNRENYENDASMKSFKETGGIEYSSDVLLGLQFRREYDEKGNPKPINLNLEKAKPVRHVEVDVLKNRNGISYGRIPFDYTAEFNYFQEL